MGRLTAAVRGLIRPRPARRAKTQAAEAHLTRTLELVVDPRQLHSTIMGHLVDLYRARRALLLLRNEETGRLQQVWQEGHPESPDAWLDGDGRLARWLLVNECTLRPAAQPEVVAHLAPDEQDHLREVDPELCLPLLAMNRLVGLVMLGDVRGDSSFEIPMYLRTQMGLALQNASLYAQQQLRLRRLSRAERLAAAGELAASAAHEIRNPLTAISSAVQLLGEAFPPGNPRREVADNVMREIDRINQIVEGLLSFARPEAPQRQSVHLGEVIEESVRLVDTMARKAEVRIRTEQDVAADTLQADRDQLSQVLINLLMNAIQAMPEGGDLTVRLTRPRRFRIEVEDTGIGMAQEEAERAFDPFYTTKERGTGLGLPICYGIVRSHGGDIDLESRVGVGTTVRVEL